MSIDLVTGATGLVGGNLVRELHKRGRKVRILIRRSSKTFHIDDLGKAIERVEGDVTDPATLRPAFEGVENVYHCAAMVSMWPRWAPQMQSVNVGGTQNIIDAAKGASVRRLIHCSSVDGIGLPENGATESDESTPWNWDRRGLANPYPQTKHQSQELVRRAVKEGLDAVIVNPTFMLGAYDPKPSSGRMILAVASGKAVGYTGGGNNFVDIEDVVDAMIAAAVRGRKGELYILGAHNLTYREIFTRIAQIVGARPPVFPVPYPLARLAGWAGDLAGLVTGKEPNIATFTSRMAYVDHYFSSTKAQTELGMRQTPIETAIERAVRWFREVGLLKRK